MPALNSPTSETDYYHADAAHCAASQMVIDRRVLNGIFWSLTIWGAMARDLPDNHLGPYTTRYNRFVRWATGGARLRSRANFAGLS